MNTNTVRQTTQKFTKPMVSLARLSWNLGKSTGKAHRKHLQAYASQCLATARSVRKLRSRADLEGLSQEFLNNTIDYGHRSLTTNLTVPATYRNWLQRRSEGCELNSNIDDNNEELILY